jgi:hypothetical protein
MRLRSDIFVSALTRRVFAEGGYGAVLRKGAEAAGAIFIRLRQRNGTETLYGPAPQTLAADDGGRMFECRLMSANPDAVDAALVREIRFDPDCWVVELEVEAAGDLFDHISDHMSEGP